MADPLPAQTNLLTRLADLCVCSGEEKCLYCESRERIEAQDRTLRLAQEKIASLQRRCSDAEEQLAAQLKWRQDNCND